MNMKISEKKNTQERPVLAQLREMAIGETLSFPAERGKYIKTACYEFGFQWDKKFKTSNNREDRTVTVTRIK